jgi:acyl-CoA thioester hydrolase
MARIKLDMPATKLAVIKIPVRISDVNYGGHVGNDAFVSIIHEARLQWLRQHNYSEMDFGGTSLILGDLAVEFKKEAFYGDVIDVAIYAGEISRVAFELYYQLTTVKNSETVLLANAKTGMVCFDYAIKKTVSVSDKARYILEGK